ncbi:hypothetical protein GQ602_006030 [Ophiocordyceps camponoti-floridani]|uniref:Uncharacterized protein n=1 Tax=Ophiocordyceps camponoti-floridani TaxID=2030778 RepID=A0A8H4Q2F3_9HYPO|nr:hypothetical protein GQ602_006030 [Ophiocordyceps camponoti-floridani]
MNNCPNDFILSSILNSPFYAPHILNHLPQPLPKDLPPGLDPSIFHFADALEDLLIVSQGQPLPNIYARHARSRMMREMFPRGEPNWFYARRLQSQLPFRPQPVAPQPTPDWRSFHIQLDGRSHEIWRSPAATEEEGVAPNDSEGARSLVHSDDAHNGTSFAGGGPLHLPPLEVAQVFFSPVSLIATGSGELQLRSALLDSLVGLPEVMRSAVDDSLDRESDSLAGKPPHDSDDVPTFANAFSFSDDACGYRKRTCLRTILDQKGREIGIQNTTIIHPRAGSGSEPLHIVSTIGT